MNTNQLLELIHSLQGSDSGNGDSTGGAPARPAAAVASARVQEEDVVAQRLELVLAQSEAQTQAQAKNAAAIQTQAQAQRKAAPGTQAQTQAQTEGTTAAATLGIQPQALEQLLINKLLLNQSQSQSQNRTQSQISQAQTPALTQAQLQEAQVSWFCCLATVRYL